VIESEEALIEFMTRPSLQVETAVKAISGDVVILGVAGKMGPTLAELLVRAGARRVIGVSRFSDSSVEHYLQRVGVETVKADLLDEITLESLPGAIHVYLMAGFKFGATTSPTLMWAVNARLPPRVIERYRDAKIVYVSSGNVCGYSPVEGPGASEDDTLAPVGDYAQSRLRGERLATDLAHRTGAELCIVRLFYATELRYGILHDIAHKVISRTPIDLTTGHVNQLWQGDANAYLARIMPLCANPVSVLNMTGQDVIAVRDVAEAFGAKLGVEPIFEGSESVTALLGDATRLFKIMGPPPTLLIQIVEWVSRWVEVGGPSLGKPTKYESRGGVFL